MTAPQITMIALACLRESPFNPRKAYSEKSLKEMSISIASQGILSPLLVRPVKDRDIRHTHEIVFGHRRSRAARLACEDQVPCTVRDMTDAEAALAQVHENGQREDVSALEEADSYARLRDEHGVKVAAIAAAIGKSQEHVYARLKLCSVGPTVREAMTDQALPPEIAVEIARLKTHPEQTAMLRQLRSAGLSYPTGWPSSRTAKDLIRARWTDDVDKAPWGADDAHMLPEAGACTTCPHRAGNDPDLVGIVAAGACTKPACFKAKGAAHTARQVESLRAAGRLVLDGEQAAAAWEGGVGQHPRGLLRVEFIPDLRRRAADGTMDFLDILDAAAELGMDDVPSQVVHVVSPGDARNPPRVVPCITPELRGRINAAWEQAHPKAERPDDDPDRSDWTHAERVAVDPAAWRRVRRATIARLAAAPRTVADLRQLVWAHVMHCGDGAEGDLAADALGLIAAANRAEEAADAAGAEFYLHDWMRNHLDTMTADQLAALLVASTADHLMNLSPWGLDQRATVAAAVAIAEAAGVDVLQAATAPLPADTAAADTAAADTRTMDLLADEGAAA